MARHRAGISVPIPVLLLPVDRFFLLFNIIVAAAFASLALFEPRAWAFAGVHLIALGVPLLLARCDLRAPAWLRAIRQLYPVGFLPLYWIELGLRHTLLGGRSQDALVASVELWIFGLQPSLAWHHAMPNPWLDGFLYAAYAAYYPLLIGVPSLVLASREQPAVRELVLRLTVTYLGCFLCYTVFPVLGPREFFPATHWLSHSIFARFSEAMRATGDSLGTAFPSSHVAGSITLAWIAWRRCSRPLAWVSTLVAGGVAFAVVYTGNHFVLDSVSATALAVALQRWIDFREADPVLYRESATDVSGASEPEPQVLPGIAA